MSGTTPSDYELVECLWEAKMYSEAEQAYLESIEKLDLQDTKVGQRLLFDLAEPLAEAIRQRQEEAEAKLFQPGQKQDWQRLLPMTDPLEGAITVVTTTMQQLSGSKAPTYQQVAIAVGMAYIHQIRFTRWVSEDRKYATRFLKKNAHVLSSKVQHKRFITNLEKRIKESLNLDEAWERKKVLLSVGAVLLDCLTLTHPNIIELRQTGSRGKAEAQTVYWTDDFLSDVDSLHALAATSSPVKKPMRVPPRDWSINQESGRLEGGYYMVQHSVYRTEWHPHKLTPSPEAIKALNTIQRTAWDINDEVRGFLLRNPQLAPQVPLQKPQRLPKHLWETLSESDQAAARQEFQDESARFVSQNSKAITFRRQMLHAQELCGQPFWQPHSFDFRGRLYPSNQMLTNQGDDISKALIRFYNGTQLGENGLNALMIHAANCYGKDKLSLSERVDFIDELVPQILKFDDDKVALALCARADEPASFYAVCMELMRALRSSDPTAFVSHIPIAVDGTCNGLQILSLLGKDQVGAEKTNCTSAPTRQDLYVEVARSVQSIIKSHLSDSTFSTEMKAVAMSWDTLMQHEAKARKVVKRAVMTTAYGVTREGIREQLVADRHCDGLPIPKTAEFEGLTPIQSRHKLAGYMRDWIVEARVSVVVEAVKIMDYFREVATVLAKQQRSLTWKTPDGCLVEQKYVVLKDTPVRTFDNWMRRLRRPTDKIQPSKMAGAAAPNIVHSLDATMCRMVANRLAEQGITEMAFVHDSYAVHACHLETLNSIIREVGVQLFKGDWIREHFHPLQVAVLPDSIKISTPPTQGELDVAQELLNATYFFS